MQLYETPYPIGQYDFVCDVFDWKKMIMMTWMMVVMVSVIMVMTYLIFVILFTRAKFLENKIYTEKRQFFALNL